MTPGAQFDLRVLARIPEASARSAYVAIIFLGATELARERLAIAPFPVPLGTIETDGTGRFVAVADGLAAGRYRVLIEDAGDFGRWPARWAEEVTVP